MYYKKLFKISYYLSGIVWTQNLLIITTLHYIYQTQHSQRSSKEDINLVTEGISYQYWHKQKNQKSKPHTVV